MSDHLLFEKSNESQITTEPFTQKQYVYCIDQNNGSYNSQIIIESSSLANNSAYQSWSEAYLLLPFVIGVQGQMTTNANAQFLNYICGLKNGYYQLIHSFSCEMNNNTVIQLTPFTNFYINYKLMTSLSKSDVDKIGQSIGFYPDTSTSWTYNDPTQGAGAFIYPNGPSISNNNIFGWETLYPNVNGNIFSTNAIAAGGNSLANVPNAVVVGGVYPQLYTMNQPSNIVGTTQTVANYGFYKRLQYIAFNYNATPYSAIANANYATTLMKNSYSTQLNGVINTLQYNILARIRLKDMSSFFEQMPLVKGVMMRFIINYNSSSQTITTEAVAGQAYVPATLGMGLASAPTLSNGTNPLLISSAGVGQGINPLPSTFLPTAGNYTFACNVVKLTIGGVTLSHPMGSTRLYVPMYRMSPVAENSYLTLNPTKTVVYRDIFQYTISVGAGQSFSNLVTNGVPNPKTVIIVPMISSLNYGSSAVAVNLLPFQSPFTTEGGTTSPLIALTNFNVQVAGINQFLQNEVYDFEQFVNELSSDNALNGGLINGLTSGLISEMDYSQTYRYYICDVSRRLSAEDSIPKSIQILGQNLSNYAITLYVFVEYQKEITLDLRTGEKLN